LKPALPSFPTDRSGRKFLSQRVQDWVEEDEEEDSYDIDLLGNASQRGRRSRISFFMPRDAPILEKLPVRWDRIRVLADGAMRSCSHLEDWYLLGRTLLELDLAWRIERKATSDFGMLVERIRTLPDEWIKEVPVLKRLCSKARKSITEGDFEKALQSQPARPIVTYILEDDTPEKGLQGSKPGASIRTEPPRKTLQSLFYAIEQRLCVLARSPEFANLHIPSRTDPDSVSEHLMTMDEIVTFVFGPECTGKARESKARTVRNWIANGKLKASRVVSERGLYKVDYQSLCVRRESQRS
jgi:hypothetical protein